MTSRLRKWFADTTAQITFGFGVGSINELCFAGMNGKEWAKARAFSALSNLITGRPYGIYRDWIFEKCGGEIPERYIRNGIIEMGAFATFQSPVYAGMLALAGANSDEVYKAVAMCTLLTPFVARPNGLYMEGVRKAFGCEDKKEERSERR